MTPIIAVDFDGTLCENRFPSIGSPRYDVLHSLKVARDAGAKLILWTCRDGELLEDAVLWCIDQGLVFDAINDNLPEVIEQFGSNPRKITATVYLDDRAANPECGGLTQCLMKIVSEPS